MRSSLKSRFLVKVPALPMKSFSAAGSPKVGAVPQEWTGNFLASTLALKVSHSCWLRLTRSPAARSPGSMDWAGRAMTEYELVVTTGSASPSCPARFSRYLACSGS